MRCLYNGKVMTLGSKSALDGEEKDAEGLISWDAFVAHVAPVTLHPDEFARICSLEREERERPKQENKSKEADNSENKKDQPPAGL